ncbi:MAG: hypothetical protein K2X43_08185 [Hyphomonadaceae bacterium]|nr:hypothetical protein [Hyphomonadaceae bacterium]
MKTLTIVVALAAGFVGLASVGQAHRSDQATLECPSVKNWAKCLWQDMDINGGG